ncbi:hypothetical protein [Ralstonia solanacearum]|nr:hypothetical protein [Ralstonia solanacearum]
MHRHDKPSALWWEPAFSGMHLPAHQAGFLDAIDAFVLMSLEGWRGDPQM